MISRQYTYDTEFRKRQIDTLKIFNDNVLEIKENEEYSIKFESAGRLMDLTVQLGVNFPNEKPIIFTTPSVQHHWVNNATGDIENAPGLLNYSQHSDLGRVVQAIIREFEKFPPPFITDLNTTPQSATLASNESSPLEKCLTPKLNDASMPNLSTLSLDELKKLDTDPEFFDDFIEEMSVVQALNEELDSMIHQVETLSRENQSKESIINLLRSKLTTDAIELKNLGDKCDKLNQKYLKKSEEFAPQHIRELLQIAASDSDAECEKHVENFLNGKINVQTFLNQYTFSKKLSSERKAKEERLAHQLNALERAGI